MRTFHDGACSEAREVTGSPRVKTADQPRARARGRMHRAVDNRGFSQCRESRAFHSHARDRPA
jgi:hypothetical protein